MLPARCDCNRGGRRREREEGNSRQGTDSSRRGESRLWPGDQSVFVCGSARKNRGAGDGRVSGVKKNGEGVGREKSLNRDGAEKRKKEISSRIKAR